ILQREPDGEHKEILPERTNQAVKAALQGATAEKPTPPPQNIGYRPRADTRLMLGVAYSTMHYWEKAGILVPRRIGRKVYYSDEAIRDALAKSGKGVK